MPTGNESTTFLAVRQTPGSESIQTFGFESWITFH